MKDDLSTTIDAVRAACDKRGEMIDDLIDDYMTVKDRFYQNVRTNLNLLRITYDLIESLQNSPFSATFTGKATIRTLVLMVKEFKALTIALDESMSAAKVKQHGAPRIG